MKSKTTLRLVKLLLGLLLCSLAACSWLQSKPPTPADFKPVEKSSQVAMTSKEDLALLEESEEPIYTIGKGDVLKLDVMGRPEVSGRMVVGPDGRVTVPLLGNMDIYDQTREAVQEEIEKRLRRYYTHPVTTLTIDEYVSNQVTVLGRVEHAGMQRFPHPPTLAEVLAGAGALPTIDKQATLTRCAIMRGRQKLIWVDLKALLNGGDPAYNMRMKKGDIIYIPDSADTAVYVMGQVLRPGSYRLTPGMTMLDAISQAGGLHEDADKDQIAIYRAGLNQVEVMTFAQLIDMSRSTNYGLENGDVLYIPRSGIAEFGYVLRQISPSLSVLNFGLALQIYKKTYP